jgi:DNA-binding transcriptional ArsR family regulator
MNRSPIQATSAPAGGADALAAAVLADCPGLDAAAIAVFALLCAEGPRSGRRLAKRIGLAQSEAFRALALLAEAGLVEADRHAGPEDPDGDALAQPHRLSARGEALRARFASG